MKLKHFAAFVFRVLGALFALVSLWSFVLMIDSRVSGETAGRAFLISLIPGLLGANLIYFSKSLAAIFCKDLDDD
jgi:hypothetical protein